MTSCFVGSNDSGSEISSSLVVVYPIFGFGFGLLMLLCYLSIISLVEMLMNVEHQNRCHCQCQVVGLRWFFFWSWFLGFMGCGCCLFVFACRFFSLPSSSPSVGRSCLNFVLLWWYVYVCVCMVTAALPLLIDDQNKKSSLTSPMIASSVRNPPLSLVLLGLEYNTHFKFGSVVTGLFRFWMFVCCCFSQCYHYQLAWSAESVVFCFYFTVISLVYCFWCFAKKVRFGSATMNDGGTRVLLLLVSCNNNKPTTRKYYTVV